MTDNQWDDKRKHKRLDVPKVVDIFTAEQGDHLGRLVNVTIEGMMIMGEESLEMARFYSLVLHLNEYNDSEPESVFCRAACLWVAPTNQEGSYWSGLEIVDISDEDSVKLQVMLDKLEA